MGRLSSVVLGVLLVAVVLMVLVGGAEDRVGRAFSAFGSLRWEWAVGAVGLEIGFVTLGGLVWLLAMRATGITGCPAHRVLGAQWLGRATACVLVGPLGVATKATAVLRDPAAREAGASRVVGSLAAQRVIENAVSGIIGATVVLIAPGPLAPVRPVAAAFLVLLPVVLVVAGRRRRRGSPGEPGRLRVRVRSFVAGARLLVDRPRLIRAGALQALAASCRVGALACLLVALGAPAQAAPLAFCLILTAGALPVLPGGVGIREAALVPGLVAGFGLGVGQALAVSIGFQAMVTAAALLVLPLALATLARIPRPLLPVPAPAPAPASSAP